MPDTEITETALQVRPSSSDVREIGQQQSLGRSAFSLSRQGIWHQDVHGNFQDKFVAAVGVRGYRDLPCPLGLSLLRNQIDPPPKWSKDHNTKALNPASAGTLCCISNSATEARDEGSHSKCCQSPRNMRKAKRCVSTNAPRSNTGARKNFSSRGWGIRRQLERLA